MLTWSSLIPRSRQTTEISRTRRKDFNNLGTMPASNPYDPPRSNEGPGPKWRLPTGSGLIVWLFIIVAVIGTLLALLLPAVRLEG